MLKRLFTFLTNTDLTNKALEVIRRGAFDCIFTIIACLFGRGWKWDCKVSEKVGRSR